VPGDTPVPAGRQLPIVFGVALTVLALDVVTKLIVVRTLSGHAPIRLLDGFLTLLLLRNSGAAFSIGASMTIVFTAIAAAVIVYILRAARKLRSLPWAITLGLLLGGATGNLADRIFRSPGLFRGDVVDWIELPHWPVFNLADSAIVCGGVLAVLLALRGVRLDGSREGADDQAAGDQAAGDQAAGDQAAGDQAAGDQAAGDQAAGDQAARDQAARDQAARDQAAGDQATAKDGDDGARPALSAGA
jgi:signal peptidase II